MKKKLFYLTRLEHIEVDSLNFAFQPIFLAMTFTKCLEIFRDFIID